MTTTSKLIGRWTSLSLLPSTRIITLVHDAYMNEYVYIIYMTERPQPEQMNLLPLNPHEPHVRAAPRVPFTHPPARTHIRSIRAHRRHSIMLLSSRIDAATALRAFASRVAGRPDRVAIVSSRPRTSVHARSHRRRTSAARL